MYRRSNPTLGVKSILQYCVLLIALFFFFWLKSQVSAGALTSAGISVSSAIKQMATALKWWADLASLQKQATIPNLFSQSMKVLENVDFATLYNALQKTADSINSTDTTAPICTMTPEDLIPILYLSDDTFNRTVRKLVLKDVSWTATKPTSKDMAASCKKFITCDQNISPYNDSAEIRAYCRDAILEKYQSAYSEINNASNLDQQNYGDEFFWNTTLDDSEYDILLDAYNLWKILFIWAKKPLETVFYMFPGNGNGNNPSENLIPDDSRIDWFMPYPDSVALYTHLTGASSWNLAATWTGWGWFSGTQWNSWVDEQISDFLAQQTASNAKSTIQWNQCLWSWLASAPDLAAAAPVTADYVAQQLAGIAGLSCNQNNICETEEDCSCVDCKLQPQCVAQQNSCNTDAICDANESCGCADCISTPSCTQLLSSGANQILENMWDNPDAQQEAKSCMEQCDEQKTTFLEMWSNIAVCYARCLCQTFESPVFDPVENPGLTSNFKIEFCMVPPQDSSYTRSKIVKTLEAIISNIKGVLQDLKEWGKMRVSVKTKEFLDSSMIKNDFAKQFSFTINFDTKPLFMEKSALTQTQEQQEFNKNIQNVVLGFWSDINTEPERNKYVFMADVCDNKARIDAKATSLDAAKSECVIQRKKNTLTFPAPISDTLQDQRVSLLNEELRWFLEKNRDFWIQTHAMFSQIKDISKALHDKPSW